MPQQLSSQPNGQYEITLEVFEGMFAAHPIVGKKLLERIDQLRTSNITLDALVEALRSGMNQQGSCAELLELFHILEESKAEEVINEHLSNWLEALRDMVSHYMAHQKAKMIANDQQVVLYWFGRIATNLYVTLSQLQADVLVSYIALLSSSEGKLRLGCLKNALKEAAEAAAPAATTLSDRSGSPRRDPPAERARSRSNSPPKRSQLEQVNAELMQKNERLMQQLLANGIVPEAYSH